MQSIGPVSLPRRFLFTPVDGASLVLFRILFGGVMAVGIGFLIHSGWITRSFVDPSFLFAYPGLEWVRPWPGTGMVIHFWVLLLCSICILLGLYYRVATSLFFVGALYVLLLDKAQFQNHFYFIALLSFLLILVPTHHAHSLDARRRSGEGQRVVPGWGLWLIRFQVGIVYFYGALAKLNTEWFSGRSMQAQLGERMDFPIIGSYFDQTWMVLFFTYAGFLFDLLVVFGLMWRRTRAVFIVCVILFHFMNKKLFGIDIFPYLMLVATPIFLPADWPRHVPGLRKFFGEQSKPKDSGPVSPGRKLVFFLSVWITLQLVVPFRHFIYPGDVHWTAEGRRFSWHMKLNSYRAVLAFDAYDPVTKIFQRLDPLKYIAPHQWIGLGNQPDMILQLARYMARDLRQKGNTEVEIRVISELSLNRGPSRPLIDPDIDLGSEPVSLGSASWIIRR